MTAVRSLAWSIWQRNHRWLCIVGGFLVFYCLYLSLFGGSKEHPFIYAIGLILVFFSYLRLIGVFMFEDSDVGIRESAFPKNMFSLPVKTAKLVLVPMALGTLTIVVTGLTVSWVLHNGDPVFPLYWPTFLMATILRCFKRYFGIRLVFLTRNSF